MAGQRPRQVTVEELRRFMHRLNCKVDVALVAVAAIVGGTALAAILALAGRG